MTIPALHRYSDWGLLVLRLTIGAIFIYHGMQKWQMADATALMTTLKFVEPILGIALLVGVLTQYAALGLGVVMLGAIYMKMTGFGQSALNPLGTFAGQGGWEFDLMIFAGCVVLFLMGAGKMSVDAMVSKK